MAWVGPNSHSVVNVGLCFTELDAFSLIPLRRFRFSLFGVVPGRLSAVSLFSCLFKRLVLGSVVSGRFRFLFWGGPGR